MSATLLDIYGSAHSVNTGEVTKEWLVAELGLVHFQRQKLERDLADAEREARALRAELELAHRPKAKRQPSRTAKPGETWLVETAIQGGGEPEWWVRSGYATEASAREESRQNGWAWRRQGLIIRVRCVVDAA